MKFIPHDYQKFALEHIESNIISALFLDMGLGRKNRHYFNGLANPDA